MTRRFLPPRPAPRRSAQDIPLQNVVLEDSVVPFQLDPSFRAVAVSHQVGPSSSLTFSFIPYVFIS